MKIRVVTGAVALFVSIAILTGAAAAQTSGYSISSPHIYKNLAVFLIHGKNQTKKDNIITLQEAMERKLFVVYETSTVNELEVENLSKQFDVFIQSGDIVKGGKQDRVLAVSIIIPAHSGRVRIEAYCVESGRWTKRGNEDANKFNSSNDRIVSKELKVAANASRSQQEVWAQVSEAQDKLSQAVGTAVASAKSSSSLQLALENEKVTATVDEYVRNLSGIANGRSDVIGFAIAINGKVNSADIYVSNALFNKVWAKMLRASATEAVAESRNVRLADPVKADAIRDMLDDAERGRSSERSVADGSSIVTREDKDNVMVEARDARTRTTVHKTYIKKD